MKSTRKRHKRWKREKRNRENKKEGIYARLRCADDVHD